MGLFTNDAPRIRHIQALTYVILLGLVKFSLAKHCTEVLSRDVVQEVKWKTPCVKKYEDRCGFFSLSYCTFYHKMFCEEKKNATVKVYYIKSECCPGYYLEKNGTCVEKQPGVVYPEKSANLIPTADPNYVEPPVQQPKRQEEKEVTLSGGGYAGIVCGLVLMLCITIFTIMAIRKRNRRKVNNKLKTLQVLYVEPGKRLSTSPSGSCSTHTHQGPSTPTSSTARVTPPRSPVKSSNSVHFNQSAASKLLPKTGGEEDEEDIPESDV